MANKEITYSGKKYLLLKKYLQSLGKSRVMLSHKEIEKILGDELPESAYNHKAFWGNNRSNNKDADHSNSWLEAGWEVEKIDKKNKIIHFKKGDKNMDKLHQRKCKNLGNALHSRKKIILKVKEFTCENEKYLARLYKNEHNKCVDGDILLKDDVNQKINMKDIARKYLHHFGINIPTTSNVNTHTAVKKLIRILEKNTKP